MRKLFFFLSAKWTLLNVDIIAFRNKNCKVETGLKYTDRAQTIQR